MADTEMSEEMIADDEQVETSEDDAPQDTMTREDKFSLVLDVVTAALDAAYNAGMELGFTEVEPGVLDLKAVHFDLSSADGGVKVSADIGEATETQELSADEIETGLPTDEDVEE